jgi:hypothetical protein
MLKKLFNIIKSTFLLILLGGISVMPWLGYLDVPIMNEDFLVLSWYEPTAFWDAFRNFYERVVDGPYWRPVIWTVNSLTKFLAGYSAWPYHLTNILVYGIVVFAFFDFLKRIGFERRRAWLGAFIFAVLPSHELSVAWIAGRTDTIMAMFLLFGMNNLVYAYKNNRYYFSSGSFFLFICNAIERTCLCRACRAVYFSAVEAIESGEKRLARCFAAFSHFNRYRIRSVAIQIYSHWGHTF